MRLKHELKAKLTLRHHQIPYQMVCVDMGGVRVTQHEVNELEHEATDALDCVRMTSGRQVMDR